MAESVLRNLPRIEGRDVASRFGLGRGGYLLATVHRPENTDHPERLVEIATALREAPMPVLFPVHPRTRPAASAAGLPDPGGRVHIVDPVGYLDMLALQRDAALVVTDSGGVQEETCMVGTPCVTVRRNTERQVTLAIGSNRLVPAATDRLSEGIAEGLASSLDWTYPARWDSEVSARVVEALLGGILPLDS
jgi:UDP-N-acetylglucosamine 2-epimerase